MDSHRNIKLLFNTANKELENINKWFNKIYRANSRQGYQATRDGLISLQVPR